MEATTRHRLWTVTRGNVLFLRELVLGGLETGRLRRDGGLWRWKGGFADVPRLSDVLDERLRTLGAGERALLEVVAAAEPVALGILEELEEAHWLESAEGTGLLDISAGKPTTVGISHPLYAEALRSGTSPRRGPSIYRRLADALGPKPAPRDLLRAATWRLEIGDVQDPDLFIAAARQALVRFDYPLAHRLAIAAHAGGVAVESLLLKARALEGQGLFTEAERTFAIADRSSVVESQRAEVATSRASNLFWHLGRNADAQNVLAGARSAVTKADVVSELTAELGAYQVFGGALQKGVDDLLSLVRLRSTSPRALVLSALALTFGLSVSGRTRQTRSVVDDVLGPARDAAEAIPFGLASLHINEYVSLIIEGRLADAEGVAQAAYEESLGHDATVLVGPHAHFLGWVTLV